MLHCEENSHELQSATSENNFEIISGNFPAFPSLAEIKFFHTVTSTKAAYDIISKWDIIRERETETYQTEPNAIYLVVSDVVEQVDKENDLFFIAAQILTVLTGSDTEQTDKMRRCCRHRRPLMMLLSDVFPGRCKSSQRCR